MTQTASLPETMPVPRHVDVIRRRGPTHEWHVLADCEPLIAGPRSPDWLALSDCSQATRVKGNRNRQVWRVQLGEQLVYAKVYDNRALRDRMKGLLRGSPAWIEWQAGLYAASIALPSVAPVAYARPTSLLSGDPGVLITLGLREVAPLDEHWLRIRDDRRAAAELIDLLAATVARAHQGGFRHRDLHVGNLLVQRESGGRLRILIVDLHSVRAGQPVGDAAVVRNLAQLNQWFRRHASLTQRLGFLKRYLHWRDALMAELPYGRCLGHDLRSLVDAMEVAAEKHATTLWAKRDRRALRDGKYFAKVTLPRGWTGHVFLEAKHTLPGSPSSALRLAAADWTPWLAELIDRLGREPRLGLIKDSHTAKVRRITLPDALGGLEVICKQSTPRRRLDRWTRPFRRSRDRRAWQNGYALLNRDLPTARPLAILERRVRGLLAESLILTEVIPNGSDLECLARSTIPGLDAASQRRVKQHLTESLTGLMKRLHARGFAHRDFKAGNVLITGAGDSSAAPRAWLIDLDGLRPRRRVSERDRLHVLMRLSVSLEDCPAVTRTDRLRFLRRWMLAPGRSDANWKQIWRQLETWSAQKRRRKARRRDWKLRHYGRP